MKTNRTLLTLVLGLAATGLAIAAPFTPGNLVIYRVGDGTLDLTNRGNVVFLDEYTTNGALVQSLMLPTNATGAHAPLIASGTATSEGLLTRSTDRRYLVFTGYGTNLTSGLALAGTTATAVPRVVGRVDASGNVDTTTVLTNFASANNPRSAASDNGINLWVGGGSGGVAYTTLGGTAVTTVSTAPVSNIRQVAIFGAQLYLSTASGTAIRIGTVGTGLPISGPVTATNLPGLPPSGLEPYSFVLLNLTGGSEFDTLYVADDAAGRGILKYSLVSGNWVSNGVITAASVRGLTAAVAVAGGATNVYLYGTTGGSAATGGGSLYAATDTAGYNAPPSVTNATVIATAATRTAFRGIAFAPVAEVRPQIVALDFVGNNVRVTWSAAGGTTNYLQAVSTATGSLAPAGFADVSGPITIPGSGTVVTNYLEPNAATNLPARYYRIRLAP